MRLTAQILSNAPVIINPEGDSVLQLRGLKIPSIENLGVTKDMYRIIDLIDNQIIEVTNIPKLQNLQGLLLARNNIVSISQLNLGTVLPNLNSITLVNNNLKSFQSIRGLVSCTKLGDISLMENEITKQKNYRLGLIWLIPSLRVIDFKQVKNSEREEGLKLFGSKAAPTELGKQLLRSVSGDKNEEESGIFGGGDATVTNSKKEKELDTVVQRLSEEERSKLVAQLKSADSLEEIERIEELLRG